MIDKLRELCIETMTIKSGENFIEARFLVYASALIVTFLVLYLGFEGHGI